MPRNPGNNEYALSKVFAEQTLEAMTDEYDALAAVALGVPVLLASGLTVAFLIAGLSAFRWLIGDRTASVKAALRTGVFLAAGLIPIQIFAGDLHGLNTLEHQPQKVAAMEANWETRGNVPLVLFALPNSETRSNDFEISIPSGASRFT